ncbi:MAG: MOSC domain-containing protein [Acidobacteriia bacterium]|nr:MOSC domain-containing protein [Terriglobia bacterium]
MPDRAGVPDAGAFARNSTCLQGSIVQINASRGGLPKHPIASGYIGELGIEGDLHAHPQIHGGPAKAILLIAAEVVHDLTARGFSLFYGALGENLTTQGIAISQLRIGDRLRAGGALLEITKPRGPCQALRIYGESLAAQICDARVKALDPLSPRWGMSGFYARVVEPGIVRTNDTIESYNRLSISPLLQEHS